MRKIPARKKVGPKKDMKKKAIYGQGKWTISRLCPLSSNDGGSKAEIPCNKHQCCLDSLLNNLMITKTTDCHRLSWALRKGCRYSEISRLSSSVLCSVRSRLWSFLNCLTGLHLPGRTLHYLTCLQKARVWHICEVSWFQPIQSTDHPRVNKIWWARVPDWWILKLRAEKWREYFPSEFFVDLPVPDLAYLARLPQP